MRRRTTDQRTGSQTLRDEIAFRARAQIGQVVSADKRTGLLKIKFATSPDAVLVPAKLYGASAQGSRSSWGRHLPIAGTYVRVAWDVHDEPYVIDYIFLRGQGDGPRHRAAGWADLTRLAADNVNRLQIWSPMEEGEWDFRSAGAAQLYLTANGRAALTAGPVGWDLSKSAADARLDAFLTVMGGDGVELRFGEIRRQLPLAFSEAAVDIPANGAPAPKELRLRIGRPVQLIPPSPAVDLFDWQVGDVRDDLGVPLLGGAGVGLRARKRYFDVTGLAETLSSTVDALGNVEVDQAATAVAGVNAVLFSLTVNATAPITLSSATPVGGVLLGSGAAPFSVTLGEPTIAQLSAITANIQAIAAALATFGGALVIPGPAVAGPALAAAMGAISTALGAIQAALAAAPGVLISNKVKTDP